MIKTVLIALGAGLVSAVVFLSATTGSVGLRALLFALTPLAIALTGMGWGWLVSLLASILGSLVVGLLSGNCGLAVVFLLAQALPMTVLVYLVGLSRPVDETAQSASQTGNPAGRSGIVEWYPVGRVVIWACGLAALISVGLLFALGAAEPAFLDDLKTKLTAAIEANLPQIAADQTFSKQDIETMTKAAIAMVPAGAAIAIAGSLLFSLWISAKIAKATEQLARPWPDLAAIDYPTGTALALAAALLAANFLNPPASIFVTAIIGALMLAYLLLGLAVIHYISRASQWRPFLLWALYIGVLFAQGAAFIIILLGISEAFLRLRSRYGGPPNMSSNPPMQT